MKEVPHAVKDMKPYEQDVFNDPDVEGVEFMLCWDTYQADEVALIHTLTKTMSGQGGETQAEAIAAAHTAKQNYIDSLEDFSGAIFDLLERDEAIDVWANVVDQTQKALLEVIKFVDERALFSLVPMSELKTNAVAFGAGRDRAYEDGVLGAEDDTEDNEEEVSNNTPPVIFVEPISAEEYSDFIGKEDEAWDRKDVDLTAVSEGDEYAEWVLDEVEENLNQQIDDLLELMPDNLYEQY